MSVQDAQARAQILLRRAVAAEGRVLATDEVVAAEKRLLATAEEVFKYLHGLRWSLHRALLACASRCRLRSTSACSAFVWVGARAQNAEEE